MKKNINRILIALIILICGVFFIKNEVRDEITEVNKEIKKYKTEMSIGVGSSVNNKTKN